MPPRTQTIAPQAFHAPVTRVYARAYRIPTESPEEDGTIAWDATVLVTANVEAGGAKGWGYTYCAAAAVDVIQDTLAETIHGCNAFDNVACKQAMCVSVRNMGRSGISACAISAVDSALWDLKAKLMDIPLATLLGLSREHIPVYGSGGFTTFSPHRVAQQIEGWLQDGITQCKIKIGRNAEQDEERIRAACDALPEGSSLFVDANGAYHPKEALFHAEQMARYGIAWFEEPVSSDDICGLQFLREHAPACMDIAAGEYGYNADDFRHLLEHNAVDILQVDATRCQGITGFLQAAALADAFHRPVSSHCAPALHAPLMCHIAGGVHMEYFSDHVRIERMLFDGAPKVKNGVLAPQTDRPGFGYIFKEKDAERFVL